MGAVKEHQLEIEGRGYGDAEGDVCLQCLGDGPVASLVAPADLFPGTCKYCGSASQVLPLDELLELLVSRIRLAWQDAAGVYNPYDHEEGRPVVDLEEYSTREVFEEEGFVPGPEALVEDLEKAILATSWCLGDPMELSQDEALALSWRSFCEEVRTRRRFTFFRIPEPAADTWERDVHPLGKLLDLLQEGYEALRPWHWMETGDRIIRARKGHGYRNAEDLGSCPGKDSPANRMSPQGIGLFYGALEAETCCRELVEPEDTVFDCTLAEFRLTRAMVLLDLTKAHSCSVFDELPPHVRAFAKFSRLFQKAVAEPLDKTEAQPATAYAPTQILTEFFRFQRIAELGRPVDGLVYQSARHKAGKSVVLFVENHQCGHPGDASVLLALAQHHEVRVFLDPLFQIYKIRLDPFSV